MKPLPVHLMPFSSGNASRDVLLRIDDLVGSLSRLNFVVRFIATDGDGGYNAIHERMGFRWKIIYHQKGLEEVLKALDGMDSLIVSDLLHLLKNARSKVLKGNVSVFGNGSFPFDARDLEQELSLGMALTDISSKERMRDNCVLEIFTLENVVRLIHKRQIAMSLFLLPHAMWLSVVMNPGMSCQMRREFLSFVITYLAK